MTEKMAKILIVILCVFVGILFSYLLLGSAKVPNGSSEITTPKVINDYKNEMDNVQLKNKQLKDRIISLQTKQRKYQEDEGIDYQSIENELYNELTKYDIMSGKVDIYGPGIEIVMSDSEHILESGEKISDYIIHNQDVLAVINELRFAGAEVIAINGYQLTWDSNIDCAGPVIYIDDFIAGTPFKIEAIGDYDKIIATIESPESYLAYLKMKTMEVSMKKKDNIILHKN